MLERAGHQLVRIHGSHHYFTKPGEQPVSIPVHQGKVKPYYVRQVQKSAKAIDRPFSPDVLREARKIAEAYQVILHCEQGHWYGRGLELPRCSATARPSTSA